LLKISQGKVHDFSREVQKLSGEVQNDLRGGAHLPTAKGVPISLSNPFGDLERQLQNKID
jgi:hypothetical protein